MKTASFLVLLLGTTLAFAADPAVPELPPLPPGPLVQGRAPELSKWTVITRAGTLQVASNAPTAAASANPPPPPQDAAGKPIPPLSTVTISKTGKIYRIDRSEANVDSTAWCVYPTEVIMRPGGTCDFLTASGAGTDINSLYTNLSKSDFQGCEWISLKYYAGIKTYSGKKCIFFSRTQQLPLQTPDGGTVDDVSIAYIDFTTRLPVALEYAGRVSLYTWQAPPDGMQSLPAPAEALIKQRDKTNRQMSQGSLKPL